MYIWSKCTYTFKLGFFWSYSQTFEEHTIILPCLLLAATALIVPKVERVQIHYNLRYSYKLWKQEPHSRNPKASQQKYLGLPCVRIHFTHEWYVYELCFLYLHFTALYWSPKDRQREAHAHMYIYTSIICRIK